MGQGQISHNLQLSLEVLNNSNVIIAMPQGASHYFNRNLYFQSSNVHNAELVNSVQCNNCIKSTLTEQEIWNSITAYVSTAAYMGYEWKNFM